MTQSIQSDLIDYYLNLVSYNDLIEQWQIPLHNLEQAEQLLKDSLKD